MKIVLISDSHGRVEYVNKIFSNVDFDYLFYIGDGLSDLGEYIQNEKVYSVSGNCDGIDSGRPNEIVFNIGKYRFLLTHGNKYGVKYTLSPLMRRAEEDNANIVCYGHSHRQDVFEDNGVYYINPGTLKDGQGLVLELEEKNVSIKLLKF